MQQGKRNTSLFSAVLLLAGLVAGACSLIVSTGALAASGTYYVSTQGNDAWSGTLAIPNGTRTDGPFATIARARDVVRALHPNSVLTQPITVWVRGGTYNIQQPLIFAPQDSGTPSAPVTYAAYPGEMPIVSGARQISGWTHYTGSALPPQVASQVWVTTIPQVAQGSWYFHQLFVNGLRRVRARTPNQGTYHYIQGTASTQAPGQFFYYPGDIGSQWATGNAELVTLQSWADTRMYITGVYPGSRLVTVSNVFSPYYLEPNARYWIENTLDSLDAPGEWFLDQKSGQLYYYPMPGEDMTRAFVTAPVLSSLVQFQGNAYANQFVTNIQLTGLIFSYNDWSIPAWGHQSQASYDTPAAVTGTGARSCSITRCTFTHLGGYAVEFSQGSQNNNVITNEMNDLGAGGVKIGDALVPSLVALQSSTNQVTDNRIHDIGAVWPSGVGIWVGQSQNNTIAHNEIYNTYYSGISVGWTFGFAASAAAGNLIQYNNIHDIGRGMLSDMGCIYTLGSQPGTVASYNLCDNVTRYWYGGWGIYMDLGSQGITAQNNLVYGTQDGGFISHYSQFDAIVNNIFALGQNYQLMRIDPVAGQTFNFQHNIVYWTQGDFLSGAWADNNFVTDYNLYYCPGNCVTFGYPSLSQFFYLWQWLGHDPHSRVADPMFADPAHGNFALNQGSPAPQIGFQPFNLSTVGPRP